MRGAGAFPLALFVLTPAFPALGQAALDGNALVLAAGAANGLFTVMSDWWRDT
ncbi:MAG: hypothetical protein AAF763_17095 [Pseudomonadota bacterium]